TGQSALMLIAVAASLAVAFLIPLKRTNAAPSRPAPSAALAAAPVPASESEVAAEPTVSSEPELPKTFSFRGSVLFEGTLPELPPLVANGANVRDADVCLAVPIPDNSLVVDFKSRGVRNVFVYLQKASLPEGSPPIAADVTTRIKFCEFEPHALLVKAGQSVVVESDDPVAYNVHAYPVRNVPMQLVVAPRPEKLKFDVSERIPMQVKDDFHPWMSAYWLVLDHPFAAITDEQGRFQIDGLPPGEYSFKVWHERSSYLERNLQVRVGGNDEPMVLKYAAEKFQR
ncbi:MAG TPA: carboxypeptidase regulatory-like domain-containing protein, partial [Planctomycetaceae bacterium]|nr:carboxypeptidase regulatory-like domain-containing protein [Planctomycetaceae bacterium]